MVLDAVVILGLSNTTQPPSLCISSLHLLIWPGSVVTRHHEFLDDPLALDMYNCRSSGNYTVEHGRAFKPISDTFDA